MSQNTEQNVRTRNEQITALTSQFGEEGTFTFIDDRDAATKHILEAEARGAAEQRRKDAEASDEAIDEVMAERDSAEEFIRKFAERVLGHSVEWSSSYGFGSAFVDVADRVAALEARVEGLEGVCRHVVWTVEEHGLGSRGHDSAVQAARAALTREGGV